MTGHYKSSRVEEPYRLAADTLGPEEIAAAKETLDTGYLTMGERVKRFEAEFADWVGLPAAVMVNSGSSANLLMVDVMLRSSGLGLKPGDEVLVPALSWPTTVWPVAQLGLVPVFVDVDRLTLGLDLESARSAMSPRTKALFLIHPLGRALDLDVYVAFCQANGLVLLEDCCESLGAFSHGGHVGGRGLGGSFSFYFSHHISTIEGGMIATRDQGLADDLRSLRAHGWIRDRSDRDDWVSRFPEFDPRFLFATTGYNVRPTDVQAAIGTVQLRRLDAMLFARESLARAVNGWLQGYAPWLELIGADTLVGATVAARRERGHSWMTLPMRLRDDAPVSRSTLIECLEAAGVETRPIIAGNLARHPAAASIAHRRAESLAVSDSLLESGLMIGCHPVISPGSLSTLEMALMSLARYS